jgi:hypothetical protein
MMEKVGGNHIRFADDIANCSPDTASLVSSSIPPEVVTLIVKWALIGPVHRGPMGARERRFFRELRSVCRLWRSTLLHSPSLWRSLLVTTDTWSDSSHPKDDFLRQLTSWFSRGGVGAPLALHIHSVPQKRTVGHRLRMPTVLELLRSPNLNFTSVWLPGTGCFTGLDVEASHPSPLASIEQLGLRVFSHFGVRIRQVHRRLARGFPNLKRLELVDALPTQPDRKL